MSGVKNAVNRLRFSTDDVMKMQITKKERKKPLEKKRFEFNFKFAVKSFINMKMLDNCIKLRKSFPKAGRTPNLP